jgi:hypothetical protein
MPLANCERTLATRTPSITAFSEESDPSHDEHKTESRMADSRNLSQYGDYRIDL